MKKELWAEYRRTWREFSARLSKMQELAGTGHTGPVMENQLLELKQARLAHNDARDRLARYLVASKPQEQTIRRTARLIWEFSGKPQNSAEKDWRRAEELVKTAAM